MLLQAAVFFRMWLKSHTDDNSFEHFVWTASDLSTDDQVLSAQVRSSLPIPSDCISTGLDDGIPRRILLDVNRLALRVSSAARL
jgi:hypothetical protein